MHTRSVGKAKIYPCAYIRDRLGKRYVYGIGWHCAMCILCTASHLEPGLFASAVTNHVQVCRLAACNVLKMFSLQTYKSRCVQSWSFSQRPLNSCAFRFCALCMFALLLVSQCHCYFRCVQSFNLLQVFSELTCIIHETKYLCSQHYLCSLIHFVPVLFASAIT